MAATRSARRASATMTTNVRVRVLFFGMLKDIVGRPEDSLVLAEGGRLETVFEHYAGLHPKLGELRTSIVLAINQEFSPGSMPLADGDEVAFLPPVSGGSGAFAHVIHDEEAGHFFALTREPIDTRELERLLLSGEDGAIVGFQGVVRNNTKGRATKHLDYECYEPMALKVMAEIGREIARAHSVSRIAMVHRLGRMEIGETSVAIDRKSTRLNSSHQ